MAKTRKRRSPVDRIMEGTERYASAHGQAQFCAGMRTWRTPGTTSYGSLYAAEQQYWKACDQEVLRLKRLVQRVLRETRR